MKYKEFKAEVLKKRIKDTINNAVNAFWSGVGYIIEHPATILPILGALGVITKNVSRIHATKAEDRRRERDYYDPRTGKHTVAKKRPTVKQQLEIERRYRAGESYLEILYDLGLK